MNMSRPLRIEYAGALYHLTSRGNRKGRIYEDDEDRRVFLELVGAVVARFGWLCHAYCLMDNHYHLLVETPDPNLSRGMRHLNGTYTQRYNFRHKRSGHLFQGRYKAILIEKERHLLELCRYMVLNPVRAGMVRSPGQWPWSSYGATAGLCRGPELLTTDWALSQFGRNRQNARREFRMFIKEEVNSPSPWEGLVGGFLLGAEDFVTGCRARLGGAAELEEVSRREKLAGRPGLESILEDVTCGKAERNKAIAKAYLEHGYRMKEIADFLGIHYTTVSRAVKNTESKMLDCST